MKFILGLTILLAIAGLFFYLLYLLWPLIRILLKVFFILLGIMMIPVIIIVAPKYLLLLIIAWVVFRLFGIDANVIVHVNRDNQRKYEYVPKFYSSVPNGKDAKDASDVETDDDEMYTNAVAIVKESQYASISYIQRRLRIGYNRAVRIIERMKREWVIKRMGENKWELVDEVKL